MVASNNMAVDFFIFGHNAILCGYFRNYIRYFSGKTSVIEKATPPFVPKTCYFISLKMQFFKKRKAKHTVVSVFG
jgi:hypothetical protein